MKRLVFGVAEALAQGAAKKDAGFAVNASDVTELKSAGVSDVVAEYLLASAPRAETIVMTRTAPPAPCFTYVYHPRAVVARPVDRSRHVARCR